MDTDGVDSSQGAHLGVEFELHLVPDARKNRVWVIQELIGGSDGDSKGSGRGWGSGCQSGGRADQHGDDLHAEDRRLFKSDRSSSA